MFRRIIYKKAQVLGEADGVGIVGAFAAMDVYKRLDWRVPSSCVPGGV